jgi:5-dehydro-4-deoxyglucarate dehydratase
MISPQELQQRARGLLSFPVTPFTSNNEVDVPAYREHVQFMIDAKPGGLFACGGTGEFFSLDLDEYRIAVRAAVEQANGKVAIIAGVGYGTKLACGFAKAAEQAGADGIMVMPPYLLVSEQEGLYQHYKAIANSTRLGVILYQRDNAIFAPQTVARLAEIPNVIGFKDGHGDMERLIRTRLAVGDRLLMLNGMPTAELSAQAFYGIGCRTYSSAVFNFVPDISQAFFAAVENGNQAECSRLLDGFYRPFGELRDRVRGFAVSLIKAGLTVIGRPLGGVRPPLLNPDASQVEELREIVEQGRAMLSLAVSTDRSDRSRS